MAGSTGYPVPFQGAPERSFTFLNISIISNQPKGKSGYQIIYTNPSTPGSSGGGIFDSEARLIGVNGRVISEERTFNSYGAGIPLQVYLSSRDSLVISSGQKKFRAKDYDGAIARIQNTQNETLQQDIFPLASELYRLLIKPIEDNLAATKIKSLVFVVDGSLQYIPMSILAANPNISKFEALRNAQLTLLKDSKSQYSHPYYWAAPILILN